MTLNLVKLQSSLIIRYLPVAKENIRMLVLCCLRLIESQGSRGNYDKQKGKKRKRRKVIQFEIMFLVIICIRKRETFL